MKTYEIYVYLKWVNHPELITVEADSNEDAFDFVVSKYEEESPDSSILSMKVKSVNGIDL